MLDLTLQPIGFYKSGRPIFPILGGSEDTPPEGTPPAPPAQAPAAGDPTDWKAEARKWEDRAKANKDATDELANLKAKIDADASTTAEQLAAIRKEADTNAATAARYKVAASKGVPADLLPEQGDEAALSTYADKILAFRGDSQRQVVAGVGDTPPTPPTAQERARAAEASGDIAASLSAKTGLLAQLAQGQTS